MSTSKRLCIKNDRSEQSNDANVKTSIVQAVEAVTGLPTHKIQVFELNS